ncbi:hypothetical protein [Paenibacillus flagellatus]|uniref:hypothetical protein n=1 Tax=Paenibacillus flagellatus TaxID=2211139 RepID=UPI0013051087|nr:hypothetical protein [Paenibacillus flagellatus]
MNALQDARLVDVRQNGRDKRYFLTPDSLRVLGQWAQSAGRWGTNACLGRREMLENE